MRGKRVIMLNEIDDKLCLPIYELINYQNYFKLKSVNKNVECYNPNKNLCYLLPCDTMVYDYLYKDKIIKLKQVLENLYILDNMYNEHISKGVNKTLNKL